MKKLGYGLSMLVAGGMFGMFAAPASAVEYNFGEVTLSIDSIASAGITMRASEQNCKYVSQPSGGCPNGNGQSFDHNLDDGNINFEQWDIVSAPVKIVSDFEFRWKNWGAFTRFRAYYDHAIYEYAGQHNTPYGRRPLTDVLRGDDARNSARGFDVLDAFVFTNFDIGSNPTTLRVGKQVINWGESLAIQGGINQFNSIDAAAIRTPGAELREALLPEESVYVNTALPGDISFEAFYAFNWRKTELDAAGTFFAGSDIFGPGGAYINMALPEQPNPNNAATIFRAPDNEADKQGQYGLKLGHYATWLNDGTDLALYFVNYHSKVPFLEYSNGMSPAIDANFVLSGYCAITCGLPRQYYRAVYPENIEYIGSSFATTIAGSTVAGEALYSWNTPFQISSSEILGAHWIENATPLSVSVLPYDGTPGSFPQGYFREDVITGQLSTITILNPSSTVPTFLHSDLLTFITNVGFQYLPNISDARKSVLSGGNGSQNSHPNATVATLYAPGQPLIHADPFSYGYRLIAITDYNNAFGTPWTLSPTIQWQHGLGTSAGNIGPGFMENRKTVTVGINANLQNKWQAKLSYTNSFGNTYQNYTQDRDFISMSVSYAF
ncbi:MAG: DUF1302 domain-containing protein [Parvibaculum sp.]|nr:DUF1302 domain-containing protein [Parvibaculum sp.]